MNGKCSNILPGPLDGGWSVVEDEWLVAMLVEDLLTEAGCIVVGPFARVPEL